MPYAPSRRTGLIFSGTGTHGLYHAGVLRALQEAGVRIDVVAGHGIGALTAMLAAVDGGSKIWDEGGLWLSEHAARYYRWHGALRAVAGLVLVLAVVLAVPFAVLGLAAIVYALGFLLTLAGLDAGTSLVAWVSTQTRDALAGDGLPTLVPRLVMLVVLAMVGALAAVSFVPPVTGAERTAKGAWWWRTLSSPLDIRHLRAAATRSIWDLVRGAATGVNPSATVLSRRYSEVVAENLGQPGCRELLLAATDLDAQRDIVGALLATPLRARYFSIRRGRERSAEVVDLAGAGRDMVIDLLGAALTPAIGAEAHAMAFPVDGYWAGETHRGCDRPGIVARLLMELDLAQVTQVIVVSATTPPGPAHRLRTPPVEPTARLGEFLVAAECAALDDAVHAARGQFDAVFTIRPAHNPIGPFELKGTYDESSDRRRSLLELRDQGYQDAYQQFIDPVVGASGEQIAPAMS